MNLQKGLHRWNDLDSMGGGGMIIEEWRLTAILDEECAFLTSRHTGVGIVSMM